ncbi:hypothetical protein [Streptomyces fulvoviolaceus]|uniref:hypothetical protein n=1 Tax=Streptomyces fulvoviolaceus TaxID=285535 RepID=UPI000998CF6E|nr:hypothetical protein [Streptomyces fulvoviolaceus]
MGADFTRYNDALVRHRINGPGPSTFLAAQADAAQRLARAALDIVDTLNSQRMYHSPVIRSVYARVRQLAHLATDSADHLLDAAEILDNTRAGLPVELDDSLLVVLTGQQALGEAGSRLTLVRDLTALGADDALTAAEAYVAERLRRGFSLPHQPPVLTAAQDAALRAVARGEVTIADNKPYVRADDLRVTISTVRALEARGLVAREECPLWLTDERVHLTPDGCRDLAASFGRPKLLAPTTARPAAALPQAAAGRTR